MRQNNMVAMILAGGRGTRLLDLTNKVAKPAVYFGGKYRIIDFPLSNCANSGIDVVGVLTQYESVLLNSYVAKASLWGLDAKDSGIYVLPPREKIEGFGLYRGTADAITQNIDFLDQYDPETVLILSGDHIYKMDYSKMLECHEANNADATIAVLEVPLKEASRFGIMNTDQHDCIIEFEEKPKEPKSNLASMGIYIFNWKQLRKALVDDVKNPDSHHDFGKDIIPGFLNSDKRLYAYRFKGYWKDVGTIDSLWEANMDLLYRSEELNLADPSWKIYTEDRTVPAQNFGAKAKVSNAYINQGCVVNGKVVNSVLFTGVIVEAGAEVYDSVLMPYTKIKSGAKVRRIITDEHITIGENVSVGREQGEIELIAHDIKGD
ncbi:MAG: glucose-1-phosphate adenylyltransferase [Erysipelotrichaceae bacterium]|nr:MAG: glucose-1-phosphate [Erysipelotrichaceae bacterium]TXT19819.1 MAG: glucose-1-phosphate adenylyltransferase [Erysipelotrichaceae bacterium]